MGAVANYSVSVYVKYSVKRQDGENTLNECEDFLKENTLSIKETYHYDDPEEAIVTINELYESGMMWH